MSVPAPDFDAQNYARPNQNWICGHACEGKPCPLGPSAGGKCQATSECRPVLKKLPGEAKGRWECTRQGGACEAGPLPDGSCCRPIAKCSPVPTLRVWRGRLTVAVVAISCAVILLLLGKSGWRNNFISPGGISVAHTGALFAAFAATNHLSSDCGACHVAGDSGANDMTQAAFHSKPGMLDLKALAAVKLGEPTAIDDSCLKCHAGKDFHHPGATPISCSYCHLEHQGSTMAATTDANCDFCHANQAKMAVATQGNAEPPILVTHFATDHPQFRFLREHLRDPDTLRFNHLLHLTGSTIPNLPGGVKLDCTFCHEPDNTGTYMRPVSFEKNCRVCHSLQFDPQTPELSLPHGSVMAVSDYLHSLPKQYYDLAVRKGESDPNGFASQKLAALRVLAGSGQDLEQKVLFSTAYQGPKVNVGDVNGLTPAVFPGCAECHEVKTGADGMVQVTPPVQTEPWLTGARFNHAKHTNIACSVCHDAIHSSDTADILLPARETCVTCHSPAGGVKNTCAECHNYHQPAAAPMLAR